MTGMPGFAAGPRAGLRPRLAVVDFEGTHLPFVLRLAQRLQDRADFLFFVDRPDVSNLLAGRAAQTWDRRSTEVSELGIPDAELLEACGRHEPLWAPQLPRLLREARVLAGQIETFYERAGVSHVLVWNGVRGLAGALGTWLARRRGIEPLFFENGYLPGTLQMSPGGVNAFSPWAARIAAGDYRGFEADAVRLEQVLDLLRSGRGMPDAVPPLRPTAPPLRRLRRELLRLFSPSAWRWLGNAFSGRFERRLPAGMAPFVLLPMQVAKDSQLSVHSPLFGFDRERLVLEVALAVQRALPGTPLVVKLHPKELAHENRALLRLARRLPQVVFLQGMRMHQLLAQARLVVTVNSTVGIEAMAFGKPVVTLGRNLYITPGLVHPVQQIEALDTALRDALRAPRPAEEIRRFLGYLHQAVLVNGSHLDLSERSLAAIERRLLDWILPGPGRMLPLRSGGVQTEGHHG